MSHLMTGSFQLMKSLNRSLILNTIRKSGPISRAEIAKKTKLTPPTVSNLVSELIESKMVIESSQGESKGGRKPTMLIINAKNFFIVGLDVGPHSIKGVFANLDADILGRSSIALKLPLTNEQFLDRMTSVIEELLKENSQYNQEHILGIGVAMHGIVDVSKGISIFAPSLQLRDIPIKDHLEAHFKMNVKVENDARALALGEAWYGNGMDISSFMCINVGYGIGAGIIIDGKLYHGDDFLMGEIGHMTIDPDGPTCSCGNHGCLQALAAGPFIAERAMSEISSGKTSILTDWTEVPEQITGELIYQGATEGDPLCIDILREAGSYLGIGITNLIHIVNPSLILLGGGVIKAGDFVLENLRATVKQRGLTEQAKNTKIETVKLGDDGTAIGAVSLLLVEVFN
ncbi:glucokinase-like ROK family protein [Pullulanibacillus pueri]|uniref:Transcriptional regulator n=1 Tax=Pullulanibacillus pueri TaxID=1437324 RepID=A0A8J2ZZ15_9BACL|nr:ROK family transcriptional regulator [Pullulanibacillus pueri]MBM7680711.1 glucokinase-like ROK family protein [Pullulanibacillus pueri]GGH87575.1 transcriptional regulator [Pullulanibacillus pueri]